MLKFQIITKDDLKEASKIERRRRLEDERKSRIFNPAQRIFGVDYDALKEQIVEKEKQKKFEEKIEKEYNEELTRRARILCEKELELKKQEQQLNNELNEYRARFQRPEHRKEYDIENYTKNMKPARTQDNDPNLGVSSAQVFSGEDLMGKDRMRAQKLQQKLWLDQQILERKQAEEDRKRSEKAFQSALIFRDKQVLDCDKNERNTKQQLLEETSNYNKQLAIQQEEKRLRVKKEEDEDNLAEIYNLLTSDMLTENKETAQSALGHNRKITYMYRGMTEEDLRQLRKEQELYLADKKQREIERAKEEANLDKIFLNQMRNVMLKQLEVDRKKKDKIQQLYEENSALAEKQKASIQGREKYLSCNKVTDEYFNKFNTTSR